MKKNLKNKNYRRFGAVFILLFVVILSGCNRETSHADHEYTCPMHPTVISDRPGSCPVCGMDLVRKTSATEQQTIDKNLTHVLQSPNESVIGNAKTIKGEFRAVPITYEAQGIVTYDTRNIFTISSRVAGRIEKLYVKFPYQSVSKGQKLAEVYSPQLITAQRELIFLLENDPENASLIAAAKNKLRLLGLSDAQLSNLVREKTVGNSFTLYSPYNGYVISTEDVPAATPSAPLPQSGSGAMDDGMGESGAPATSASVAPSGEASLVKEGNYVSAGQTIFKVVNNSSLRVELDLPADLASSVRRGDQLKMDFGAGHEHVATVDFIQPFFDKDREFVKVRVNTSNTEDLHIGHLLQAKIKSDSIEGLWIPRQAIVDLGKNKIVFLWEKEVFRPHVVTTGVAATGMIQVLKGLTTSDEIAENAQFLVDSESIIKHEN